MSAWGYPSERLKSALCPLAPQNKPYVKPYVSKAQRELAVGPRQPHSQLHGSVPTECPILSPKKSRSGLSSRDRDKTVVTPDKTKFVRWKGETALVG